MKKFSLMSNEEAEELLRELHIFLVQPEHEARLSVAMLGASKLIREPSVKQGSQPTCYCFLYRPPVDKNTGYMIGNAAS